MKKLKGYQNEKTKIIIFDFDGVLADTIKIKGDVFFEIFHEYGRKVQIYARNYHFSNIGLSREYKFIEILNVQKRDGMLIHFPLCYTYCNSLTHFLNYTP